MIRKNIFYIAAVGLMLVAIALGFSKGAFSYKSTSRQIELTIESQDAETASAILSLISMLIGAKQSHEMRGR